MSYEDDKLLALLPLELPHDQKNEYHSFIPNKIPNETKNCKNNFSKGWYILTRTYRTR